MTMTVPRSVRILYKFDESEYSFDGAYAAAMTAYGCRLEDILAVFSHSPLCSI